MTGFSDKEDGGLPRVSLYNVRELYDNWGIEIKYILNKFTSATSARRMPYALAMDILKQVGGLSKKWLYYIVFFKKYLYSLLRPFTSFVGGGGQ